MAPLGVGSSDSTYTLKSGEAKLWLLLVGVNDYQDISLPSLRYPALDCQGLEESLVKATEGFPNKEIVVHHDFARKAPEIKNIRQSLYKIVSQSQPNDSILLYFSGHGMLEPNTQEAVLCFSDTNKSNLLATGLPMQELVEILSKSPAKQQLLCLDTCHSGDMALLGARVGSSRDGDIAPLSNSTPQLMNVLRHRASQSKGFCALLSCDRGQQSWEFPELGHGVFTYYLMRGLSGEAADNSGFIDADGLYKYVYRQTVQYIDKLNHQVRLINQQKRERGDSQLYPEYPIQTPKRIVEGVGELIVGFKPNQVDSHKLRRALIIDGLANRENTHNLSQLLKSAGDFEVECFYQQHQNWSEIRTEIQKFTQVSGELNAQYNQKVGGVKRIPTCLLYLRGYVEEKEDGEACLVLGDGVRLSRCFLRQLLRRTQKIQQIVILDLISSESSGISSAQNWIEDLQCGTEYGQCLIVTQTPVHQSAIFSQIILESLVNANPQVGLPVAKWISQLQKLLQSKGVNLHTWLSGTQAIIDILPGNINQVFHNVQQIKPQNNIAKLPDVKVPIQSPNQLIINFEKYTELEELLKKTIGIIASKILQQSIKKVGDYQQLIEKLTDYIPLQEKILFKNQATAILEIPSISTQSQLAKSSTTLYQTIDADFISKCESYLTYSIGPIANFIIQETLQSHPLISITEFVDKLLQNIPDYGIAMEFKKRILER
ncbi:caspase family protein [Plectonema cf. radiosum LEGE 06105]|uniref:Caspase family protein n=1 Tax=Plectonema cf. radiosum LEGE 06105 TaxID=945769 RepID=A0A8J7F350_9CYAN|nr:caspase family protein [Plectonema radiosum]MBE9214112.1 caspase family protein [Plectonema cf. radiosum LEGE 06105]